MQIKNLEAIFLMAITAIGYNGLEINQLHAKNPQNSTRPQENSALALFDFTEGNSTTSNKQEPFGEGTFTLDSDESTKGNSTTETVQEPWNESGGGTFTRDPTDDTDQPVQQQATPRQDASDLSTENGQILAIINKINSIRAQQGGLGPLKRWAGGEDCARKQAEADALDKNPHSHMDMCSGGRNFGQNTFPSGLPGQSGWTIESIVSNGLQNMWNEKNTLKQSREACEKDSSCFSKHGHYLNMSSTKFTEVAVGIYKVKDKNGNFTGEYWVNMNFR